MAPIKTSDESRNNESSVFLKFSPLKLRSSNLSGQRLAESLFEKPQRDISLPAEVNEEKRLKLDADEMKSKFDKDR